MPAVPHRPAALSAPARAPRQRAIARTSPLRLLVIALLGAPPFALAQVEPAPGWRPDRVYGQVGHGVEINSVAVGAVWDGGWRRPLGRGMLTSHHELTLGHWRSDAGLAGRSSFTQLGVTPSLRYWPGSEATRWFAEAGIGINLLDPLYRTRDKAFSTAFNFGDHLGVGYRSPDAGWETSLRLQHFSNGGIRKPNPGENFVQWRWSMAL